MEVVAHHRHSRVEAGKASGSLELAADTGD